jgi:hypothetical protein
MCTAVRVFLVFCLLGCVGFVSQQYNTHKQKEAMMNLRSLLRQGSRVDETDNDLSIARHPRRGRSNNSNGDREGGVRDIGGTITIRRRRVWAEYREDCSQQIAVANETFVDAIPIRSKEEQQQQEECSGSSVSYSILLDPTPFVEAHVVTNIESCAANTGQRRKSFANDALSHRRLHQNNSFSLQQILKKRPAISRLVIPVARPPLTNGNNITKRCTQHNRLPQNSTHRNTLSDLLVASSSSVSTIEQSSTQPSRLGNLNVHQPPSPSTSRILTTQPSISSTSHRSDQNNIDDQPNIYHDHIARNDHVSLLSGDLSQLTDILLEEGILGVGIPLDDDGDDDNVSLGHDHRTVGNQNRCINTAECSFGEARTLSFIDRRLEDEIRPGLLAPHCQSPRRRQTPF